ncbi:MAG: molybdopterin-dependent oxidoreductase [Rhodobacteraceae bacterium]|nr:molybdopterin-dependent oxidoreductase [Paracoccaceae bacterium]
MKVTRPDSLEQALSLITDGGVPVAGGTAFQLEYAQGTTPPAQYVPVGHLIPTGIKGLTIGAGTPLEDLRHAGIPLLSDACRDMAAPNIRRLGTLGGNLAWRKGCLVPALIALDALITTTNGSMPVLEYLSAPDGLVLSITLRPLEGGQIQSTWRKVGLRQAFTGSVIATAGMMSLRDNTIAQIRLAAGGGATPAQRLTSVEDWLVGQNLHAIDQTILRQRLDDAIIAVDCPFRTASYRRKVAAASLAAGLFGLPLAPRNKMPEPSKTAFPPTLTELSRLKGGDRWHTRPDMPAKLRGTFPYLTDKRADGMLVGRILRAGRPHALIRSIDTTKAESLDGVEAVVTHRDIKGLNAFGIVFQDQPALCHDKVRYTGDAVAAVAAIDVETAERALSLIDVVYEDLPVVSDASCAIAPDAPPVHAAGNLVTEVAHGRGDTSTGWAQAVHIVEDTYVTPRQMHGFMETEGGWAAPEGDGLIICAGGQHGSRDQMQLARILDVPADSLRVVTSPTGGAFGGKDELTVQPALALLAQKSGKAVRLHLSRAESVQAGTKRNPLTIRMKTGCDAQGKLVAQEVDVISDCGAYASLAPGVLETALEHVAGPYNIDHYQARGRLAYTNNGTCGAFRGFGANQMTFAIECQMDRLAVLAGLDPLEIRHRNLRIPGSPGVLGQRVAPSERLSEMLAAAAHSDMWQPFPVNADEIAGVGMALNYQGNGLGTIPQDEADFGLALKDGKIQAVCGLDEMGQGLTASLHGAVADRLGCARSDVCSVTGDTKLAPDSGSTTAARGGFVVWQGVNRTAPAFEAALLERAATLKGCTPETLKIVQGGVGETRSNTATPCLTFAELGEIAPVMAHYDFPKTEYTKGNARFIFAFGATLARVAVNRITGMVRVVDLEMHTAAGPVIDMASYLGQMEGGLVQGLGYTLTENMTYQNGLPVAGNFDSYTMPSVKDVPEAMRITAHEGLDANDPYGPRGAGELGIGAIMPAIANAVATATGHCPPTMPIAPETMLEMLEGTHGSL